MERIRPGYRSIIKLQTKITELDGRNFKVKKCYKTNAKLFEGGRRSAD